jgi:hypothetical protein
MSLIVRFEVKNMDSKRYAEVLRRLTSEGQGSPTGRLYHVSFGAQEALQVVDVWDTESNFRAFGEHLVPILKSLGVEVTPDVSPVHHIIRA